MKAVGSYIFAGGFTLGVEKHFEVLAHLEGDGAYGADSAALNWPDLPIFHGPKNWPLHLYRDAVDFVYCNPPCAIFSSMGIVTTRGKNAWRAAPRVGCWADCFSHLENLRPRAWALESVTNAYTVGRELVDDYTRRALLMGYSVTHLLLDARWCGIPQSRKRFFLICHKPAKLTGYQHNWAPPPTVGEALSEVSTPGWVTEHRADLTAVLMKTPPGGRLSTYWELEHPGYETNLNAHGKVKGRPSFQDGRLDASTYTGAYAGDKRYHPTEHRLIGINEAKALCGYPEDFQLAGNPRGWGSLLARAVMPPVGAWLASAVKATLEGPDVTSREELRVTLVDVREPDRPAVDLTADYLDDRGRVRLKVRAATGDPAQEARPPWVPPDAVEAPPPTPALPATPPPAAPPPTSEVQPAALRPPPPSIILAEVPDGADETSPLPGEGSGKLLQRLLMTGRYTADALVAIVHRNWEGRTTKVGDVYYNYRKLLDAGMADVPPWPGKAVRSEPRPKSEPRPIALAPIYQVPAVVEDTRPRFLITGASPIQVGSKRTQLKIITSMAAWATAVEELGFAVDWQPVHPGDNLSHYAGVICGLNKPNSISSGHFYGALWTLLKRPDAIVALDDWQTKDVLSGVQSYARSRDRAFKLLQYGPARADPNNSYWTGVFPNEDELFEGVKMLAQGNWLWPIIVPILGDGDVTKLAVPASRVVAIDPTSLTLRYSVVTCEARERRWVQASLGMKNLPPQFSWPIQQLGALARGKGGVGTRGDEAQPRLTEPELMNLYCAVWGVISPAHPHAGSGWWRVRYLMSADAGCVLSADSREAACLGEPYLRASSPRDVEALDDYALEALALEQADCLKRITWPKERVLETLSALLRSRGIQLP